MMGSMVIVDDSGSIKIMVALCQPVLMNIVMINENLYNGWCTWWITITHDGQVPNGERWSLSMMLKFVSR